MTGSCVFCHREAMRVLAENGPAFAIRDLRPATDRHSLVLPKRHVPSFFDLTDEETQAIGHLLRQLRDGICAADSSVEGFNIGINVGEAAGQTIFHCHYHLIPRRRGDVPDPRGGVRWVIPSKAFLEASPASGAKETS
jgi:ATP adenylyltransferase